MIDLQDISLIFGKNTTQEKKVLKHINITIPTEEFITVIGSNGAGKSSLLNLIAGEYVPSLGKIICDSKDISSWKTNERAALVSRVFQDPMIGTCSELTVIENLALAECRGRKRGFKLALNKKDYQRFALVVAELKLDLEKRLDAPVSLLSGGQRQALSLVMASLSASDILLLDEHTSALDPHMAEKIMALTTQIIGQKKLTTLMVTHSLKQALEVGSRTIMLHNGQIIYDVKGEERKNLTPSVLLQKFSQVLDSDQMLFEKK
jgi:putative ABC transport system ATP-binding protein